MKRTRDEAFIAMAYGLAEKARGRTSPNPMVGAVIVDRDRVVGWGFHEEAGRPHAEIMALEKAGRRARGATLYLTLEPCVHWGRTPPCIDRLLESGLARYVISARDPNPLVNGRGLARLEKAGFPVSSGLLAEYNEKLNETYIKLIRTRLPLVTIKAAVSLDGRMAAASGDSRWISGPTSREYAHYLREENDAVMVGSGTVLKDDPLLTVRHGGKPGRKITRVVMDSRLRTPLSARLLSAPEGGPVVIFAGANAPDFKVQALERAGVAVVVDGTSDRFSPAEALRELGRRDIASVLVEGGSALITSFLEAHLADKAVVFVAPKLIGGRSSPGLMGGKGAEKIADCLELANVRSFSLESDIIIEGYIKCSQG